MLFKHDLYLCRLAVVHSERLRGVSCNILFLRKRFFRNIGILDHINKIHSIDPIIGCVVGIFGVVRHEIIIILTQYQRNRFNAIPPARAILASTKNALHVDIQVEIRKLYLLTFLYRNSRRTGQQDIFWLAGTVRIGYKDSKAQKRRRAVCGALERDPGRTAGAMKLSEKRAVSILRI